MPGVKDVLRVLGLIKHYQPVHTYGFAVHLGKPAYASTLAWRWFHYLEELGVLKKITEDEDRKTARKDYVLTEKGEKLLTVLEEVWGEGSIHNISDIYQRRRQKGSALKPQQA